MSTQGASDQFMNERDVPKMTNFSVAYKDVGEGREQERKLCET